MMKFLTESEVAQILDCSPKTIAAMCKAGKLPYLKIGNERRIPLDGLEEALRRMVAENDCSENSRGIYPYSRVGSRSVGKHPNLKRVETKDASDLRKATES